jgi:hypothetical protein
MKVFTLALLVTVAATAASAQSLPECKGHFEVIRADAIKPGKMDEFRKAVADHQAWYKAHGLSDRILLAQIIKEDISGTRAYAQDQAITVHVVGPMAATPPPDDAWNAFLAEYKDSSSITNTTNVCVLEPAS